MNTGLNLVSGSVDLDLAVKEVVGGVDTLWFNDFDGNEDTTNCVGCIGQGRHTRLTCPRDILSLRLVQLHRLKTFPYEADHNPTTYMWAGLDYNGTAENNSGYQ